MTTNELSKRIQQLKKNGATREQVEPLIAQLNELRKLEKKKKALNKKLEK